MYQDFCINTDQSLQIEISSRPNTHLFASHRSDRLSRLRVNMEN